MKKEVIEQWERAEQLRKRTPNKERIKSMIESAITNMIVVKTIALTEQSSILIFRETYESIRQLGDAQWWLIGYEPKNHEISMNILKEMELTEKTKLQHLSRFKSIRNDANYRGFRVTTMQAKEILEFWDICAEEIIAMLQKQLN